MESKCESNEKVVGFQGKAVAGESYFKRKEMTAGKIFTKDEADRLFGPVLDSVTRNTSEFNAIMNKTVKNMMFRVVKGKLTILGDHRQPIYPESALVTNEDVFARASKSVVVELLSRSKEEKIFIEIREEHTTVTYGYYTMEEMAICPPYCW